MTISVKQSKLKAVFQGIALEAEDGEANAFLHGGIGVGTLEGSHVACEWIQIDGE